MARGQMSWAEQPHGRLHHEPAVQPHRRPLQRRWWCRQACRMLRRRLLLLQRQPRRLRPLQRPLQRPPPRWQRRLRLQTKMPTPMRHVNCSWRPSRCTRPLQIEEQIASRRCFFHRSQSLLLSWRRLPMRQRRLPRKRLQRQRLRWQSILSDPFK